MAKLSKADKRGIPVDVVNVIEQITSVATLATPLISKLFDQLNNWIATLGKNNPNSPKNVRLRLAALEGKDTLQKELNKRNNEFNKLVAEKLSLKWE
jgi:hypothetical protein